MSDVDGVLAAIDTACDDWAVSQDAMRSAPGVEEGKGWLPTAAWEACVSSVLIDDPFIHSLSVMLVPPPEHFILSWFEPDEPWRPEPADPRERALEAQRCRNTGPDRPSGNRARRPRRLP